jgi:glycerol-3-phosphate O-acyltransferase/dihydroxyacetone phosphate acyltransferase
VAYRILTWFLRVVTRVFFRQVEVVGLENVPAGPVIFAGNHPNSLIDPILLITTCGRRVSFAAKDTLFKGRILRAVLRGLGAVPIKRRTEHDGDAPPDPNAPPVDNDAAFSAMFEVLGAGGAIGIFPEGISHDAAHLSKLKTGAARLALGAAARTGKPIPIVPCGLTFIHPKRFRSRVLVQLGTPIMVTTGDAKQLTAQIEVALQRLTINAPDWDTVRALDGVRRLYQPQEISIEERVELARRFNAYYAQVAEDPRVRDIMRRVGAYQDKLDELGISDRELARDLSKLEITLRVIRQLVLVAFWSPLTIPAAPLHVPTLIFARLAGPRLTPRKDVIATTKMLSGMLLVLASYLAAIGILWWKAGFAWAILGVIVLPLSGWATLRVLDRLRLARRGLGVLVHRLRFRRMVKALRTERAALAADVIRVVGEVKPPGLDALFPPEHPDRAAESWRTRDQADLDAEQGE